MTTHTHMHTSRHNGFRLGKTRPRIASKIGFAVLGVLAKIYSPQRSNSCHCENHCASHAASRGEARFVLATVRAQRNPTDATYAKSNYALISLATRASFAKNETSFTPHTASSEQKSLLAGNCPSTARSSNRAKVQHQRSLFSSNSINEFCPRANLFVRIATI